MAFDESVTIVSRPAGTTFSTGDLYKFVVVDTDGSVLLPNTTGNVLPYGTLYDVTATTSTDAEAVPVALIGAGGIGKVRLAASTLATGGYVGSSTAGMGIAPTTDAYTVGQIVDGSSGNIRVVSVNFFTGPLSTP